MSKRYSGGAYASNVKFSWQREDYTPAGLANVPTKEIEKEYSRLRDIAMKRLERLRLSKFSSYRTAQNFLFFYAPRFKNLKDMPKKSLPSALADLRYFLESPYGSVSGYREVRKKQLTSLHNHGYKFVNESNLDDFIDFMGYVKGSFVGKGRYLPEDALYFEKALDKGMNVEEMKQEWEKWKTEQMRGTNLQNKTPSGMKNRKTAKEIAKATGKGGKMRKQTKKTTHYKTMLNGKRAAKSRTKKTTKIKKMLTGK